jgi:predicted KAP-like P-loop ATPase
LGHDYRFTVIIDDLDRLEPAEAMEILRLVRKVADFPAITYIICFDRDVLAKQVEKALQLDTDGHEFVEKMLQTIISVPPQEPFALRRYLQALLTEAFPGEMNRFEPQNVDFSYRRHSILNEWTETLVSTPRDAVRLYETIRIGWPFLEAKPIFSTSYGCN